MADLAMEQGKEADDYQRTTVVNTTQHSSNGKIGE